MRTSMLVGVLSAALATGVARAEIIHFINPEPGQPGHYNWRFEPGTVHWLDITQPSGLQSNLANGRSVSQASAWGDFNVHRGEDFGPFAQVLAVAGGWSYPTLSLSLGEPVQSHPFETDWFWYAEHAVPSEFWPGISHFAEGQSGYMGVRTSGGQVGWIEVVRTGMSLSARSWAYEAVPGAPIYAGQVPAPGGVALVLGAGCVLARRRRA